MDKHTFVPVDVFIEHRLGFEFPDSEEYDGVLYDPVFHVDSTFWEYSLVAPAVPSLQ